MRGPLRNPIAAIAAALLFAGAGCISFSGSGQPAGLDGGVFRSGDKGDTWEQRVAVLATGGQAKSIGGVNVTTVVQDPSDPNALYVGTSDNGMFYSYDGGASWQQPAQVSRGRVAAIAVDAKDKCTVYLTFENKLLKTDDCSRTWNVTYLDPRPDRKTSAALVDFFNPSVVWVATDSGDVLKSTDAGASWASMRNFNNPVLKMAMHAGDSRKLLVATKTAGIWRTDDSGGSWKDLREGYRDFSGSGDFSDMALGSSDANVVVMSSKYGLLRSADFGDTWESIDLLTPPGTTLIYSVAVDPKDANGIYYGTSTTFYRTPNGGVNWVPKKLPTSRTATALAVDRMNSSVLYMGVTRFK